MKTTILTAVLLLGFISLSAQSNLKKIWHEDFDCEANGAQAAVDYCPGEGAIYGDAPALSWVAYGSISVQSGALNQSSSGSGFFVSDPIDISTFDTIIFKMSFLSDDSPVSSYIDVYYSLDNQPYVLIDNYADNPACIGHTFVDDFFPNAISAGVTLFSDSIGANGLDVIDKNSISFKVECFHSGGNGFYAMNFLTVENKLSCFGPPICETEKDTVYLDQSGQGSITVDDIIGTTHANGDDCELVDTMLSKSSFDVDDLGLEMVNVIVTDECDKTSTCPTPVLVLDTITPHCNFKETEIISLDPGGNAIINPLALDLGTTDNHEISSYISIPSVLTCKDIGLNTLLIGATDPSGNACYQPVVITIEDNQVPVCMAQDVTLPLLTNGTLTLYPSDVDNNSSDNCFIQSRTVSPNFFDCDDIGTHTVTLTIVSVSGEVDSCTAQVTITSSADLDCNTQDITLPLDASGNASIEPNDVYTGDASSCNNVSVSVSPNTFDCSHLGANTVTVTVTDGATTNTCSVEVFVVDNMAPDCQAIPNFNIYLDENGHADLQVSDIIGLSSDNCGIVQSTVNMSSFSCFQRGSTQHVELTLFDSDGNGSSCYTDVSVVDTVAPWCVARSDTLVADTLGIVTLPNDLIQVVVENCFYTFLVSPEQEQLMATPGVYPIEFEVLDLDDNSGTCISEIKVGCQEYYNINGISQEGDYYATDQIVISEDIMGDFTIISSNEIIILPGVQISGDVNMVIDTLDCN